jgi:hypothetical protein
MNLFCVDIELYGFDSGSGLPPPLDYRDMPHYFRAGLYEMDRGDRTPVRSVLAKRFIQQFSLFSCVSAFNRMSLRITPRGNKQLDHIINALRTACGQSATLRPCVANIANAKRSMPKATQPVCMTCPAALCKFHAAPKWSW